jgi:hypothetical protein
MTEQESKDLALLLSSHLRQLSPSSLADYLRAFYGLNDLGGLSTELVYAIEVSTGNLENGDISSVPVRTWEIGRESCRSISFINMVPFNAASDNNRLWPHPIVSYYAEFPKVLSKEGIGQVASGNGIEQTLKFCRILTINSIQGVFTLVAEEKAWLFRG